ncbi:MAG: prolipoprotein diacylglyceryl transferase [Bacteroidota bacterium]|nr:prolipoprotein diacylglyceryl transferase [Bacteroidota bacterium]MDP4205367.1 prolipoprotein diacylglyceryl transferase [Bacteroidota bacterium]
MEIASIIWNVKPEIFSLDVNWWIFGTIAPRWYGFLFALGFLLGYNIEERMFKFEKVNPKWMESIFLYVLVATVVGARLGHVFFYEWGYYSQHLAEIPKIWHGGLASHGGTIGIIIAIYFFSKKVTHRPIIYTLDRLAVPVALAAACIRFGNLMNSEIYGVQTSLPWGFIFVRNGETLPKHPTQIYEALSYLITFGIMMYLYWKTELRNKQGFLLGVFFIGIFLTRFFIEFIKQNQVNFENGMALNMGQILSIPFVLAGIFLIIRALKLPAVIYPPYDPKKG